MDNTTDIVVPLWVVLLSRATWSPLGSNEVEFEIEGAVDLTSTYEVRLTSVVGATTI